MAEIDREKYKLDRNAIMPKKFPSKVENIKYPGSALNTGNALYRTTNRDYGSKPPTNLEIPSKYFPKDATFTKFFPGSYKFNGLNTAKTFSKVH
jgi:hypothetical protein